MMMKKEGVTETVLQQLLQLLQRRQVEGQQGASDASDSEDDDGGLSNRIWVGRQQKPKWTGPCPTAKGQGHWTAMGGFWCACVAAWLVRERGGARTRLRQR